MSLSRSRFFLMLVLLCTLAFPLAASADTALGLLVSQEIDCDSVTFLIEINGGTEPYTLSFMYGDGEETSLGNLDAGSVELQHQYPAHGEYAWSLLIEDAVGETSADGGTVILEGPDITLSSTPFPPLLTIDGGEAPIEFLATSIGDTDPVAFLWDLDGDGEADEGLEGSAANYTYGEGGEYTATVTAVDSCGFTDSESLTIIVVDPEEDADEVCHPMAQRIAEAVSGLFPDQAEQLYSCDDIFDIFQGALFGNTIGFGRMWHAYQLAENIEDLTWETILDWQLNNTGWGALVQLDRFAEVLEEQGIQDLIDLVSSDDYTLGDVRSAIRAVTRYEADFEDALGRIAAGANPGELGQFYGLVADLGVEPADLDVYLEEGASVAELSHAARLAERMNANWEEIAAAKTDENSWGEIGQALRLADDETSAAEILAMGVQEYRALEREADRTMREDEQDQRTAERLAEQYEAELGDVMALFNGECEGDWSCVRSALREQERTQRTSAQDERTAAQIADKYHANIEQVWAIYETTCELNWPCTRAYFRDLSR